MSETYGLLVEFKAKYDTVTKGFNDIAKGSQNIIDHNKKVSASFNDLTNHAKSGADTILNKWLGLGVALSAGGLIAFFNKTANSIDKITDSARGLGIAADELKKLKYGAELGGSSIEEIEGNLKKFNITLGKALKGNEEAAQSFKNIGISISDLKGKDLASQFITTATALANIKDKNIAAADGMEIFGKSYETALKLGRDGIAENIKEFDKLGATLTNTQRKAVDAFGDAKTKLNTIFEGFFEKVVAGSSPAFTKLVDQVSDFITTSGGIDGIAENVANKIKSIVDVSVDIFRGLIPIVNELFDKLGSLIKKGKDITNTYLDNVSNGNTNAHLSNPGIGDFIYDIGGEGKKSFWKRNLSPLAFLSGAGVEPAGFANYDPNDNSSLSGIRSNPYNQPTPQILNSSLPSIMEAMKTATSKATDGIRDWTHALYKSSDILTTSFDTLDKKDTSETLNEIMGIISDKGLVNRMTQTATRLKENPDYHVWSEIDFNGRMSYRDNGKNRYLLDDKGNPQEEKYNLYPKATNTDFETNAAQIVADIKKGKFGGKNISSSLDLLRSNAADNANAGFNNTGEIGIIAEIKKFAESMGAITEKKKIDVNITVTPTKDFTTKVVTSEDNKQQIVNHIEEYTSNAARS